MPGGARRDRTVTAAENSVTIEELRRSEERLRLMIEAVKDYAIFLLDPEGYISSWNEGAQRLKGYTSDEIIGQHFSIFYPEEALARRWPEHELRVARLEGRFEDEGWRVRKDGSRFWANVVITALFDDEGTLVGFTKVTRDLTERKLHEEALEQSQKQLKLAYRELEQKNRALERANLVLARRNAELQDFAYAASHDLQEPLRKISTFSELLELECQDEVGREGRMFIDRIRHSAVRMSMLISGLLAYSRVATLTQPFQKVDLNQIIEGVLDDLQLLLQENGGRVDVESLPPIEADPIQMRRLFQNLIENALKFHRTGVPTVVRITPGEPAAIRDVAGRQICTIDVADNGIGFEEKYLDRIFVPFQRLHTLSHYQGAGLGLAICKRIVERHEGTITARSTLGHGATFTISLPVHHVPEVTSPQT